jgi:ribosomal protein S18 acetylase RimI-like enzyme
MVRVPLEITRTAIRRLLETDRAWCVYALADLAPGFFGDCRWYTAPGGIALFYTGFPTAVFFYHGDPDGVPAVLAEAGEERFYLQVRPEAAEAMEARYRVEDRVEMLRMALDPGCFNNEAAAGARLLTPEDLPALLRLYAAEPPEFFFPSMLGQGVFHGMWDGAELAAVAGTHIVNLDEQVAAIGNVYTRPVHRGRGLAGALTSAVCADLLRRGVQTVALNVRADNEKAVRVYRRLGFTVHCRFIQGVASRI